MMLTVAEGLAAAGHRVDLVLRNAKGDLLPAVRGFARVCSLHARSRRCRRELSRAVYPSVRIAHFGPRWSPLWLSRLRLAAKLAGTAVSAALIDARQAHDVLAVADYIRRERPRALLANLAGGEVAALLGGKVMSRNPGWWPHCMSQWPAVLPMRRALPE